MYNLETETNGSQSSSFTCRYCMFYRMNTKLVHRNTHVPVPLLQNIFTPFSLILVLAPSNSLLSLAKTPNSTSLRFSSPTLLHSSPLLVHLYVCQLNIAVKEVGSLLTPSLNSLLIWIFWIYFLNAKKCSVDFLLKEYLFFDSTITTWHCVSNSE